MTLANTPRVAVTHVQRGDVLDAVRTAMEAAEWFRHIPPGSSVALKPNLCWDYHLPGAQTSPWVLDAVIRVLRPTVADIVVIEAGQVTVDADRALRRCGLEAVLHQHGIEFVNMSKGRFSEKPVVDGMVLHQVLVPEVLEGRVLVTLPVMKTHSSTGITGALKNQWGCLPENRHELHPVVDRAVADINAVLRPSFAVMDATIAMEGCGPKTGRPRVCDLVLASADMVALDSTAARIMGFEPESIQHIVLSEAHGVGSSRPVEAVGEIVPVRPPFARPKEGLIAHTEKGLRHSRLRHLAFDTRAFALLATAAKWYNAAWYATAGRARRRRVLKSGYGELWRSHHTHRTDHRREDGPS